MFALSSFLEELSLLAPLACIFLFLSNRRMRARLDRIEERLSGPVSPEKMESAAEETTPSTKDRQTESREMPARRRDPARDKRHSRPWSRRKNGEKDPEDGVAPRRASAGSDIADVVIAWTRQNWILAVSALCLALAGIYAAQYAADHGMVSPRMRIAMAALLGAAFIAAGEVIRRRTGDEGDVSTAYLPSVFSGAGIVTLFGAVLTARYLYGMIEAPVAFGLLAGVASLSVVLGWFYGPVLAAVGLLGATVAPFLVGGETNTPGLLNGYFGVVALAGLSINALRKWPWIDALALILPYGAVVIVLLGHPGGTFAFIEHSALLALVAGAFMGHSLSPRLEGPSLLVALVQRGYRGVPRRQKVLVAAWTLAVMGLVLAGDTGRFEMIVATGCLSVLFVAGARWSRAGSGAIDLVALSGAGLFLLSLLRNGTRSAIPRGGAANAEIHASYSWSGPFDIFSGGLLGMAPIYALILAGLIASAVAIWRSFDERGATARAWSCAAAVAGPGLMVAQEVAWAPAAAIGPMVWASVAMLFAAGATFVAERSARVDPEDHLRVALAAVTALSMVTLALFVLLTQAALTVALAVLVLGCVVFDDRFKIPGLGWFAQAGTLVLAYRAVVDPGLEWGMDASYGGLVLAYALPAIMLGASRVIARREDQDLLRAALEGSFLVLSGTGVSVLILRLGASLGENASELNHWTIGLMSCVWLIASSASLWGALAGGKDGGRAQRAARALRLVVAAAYGLLASTGLAAGVIAMNPGFSRSESIWGVVGLSSLLPAYLLPGVLLLAIAGMFRQLKAGERSALAGAGGFLAFLYVCLSVMQFWRGNTPAGIPMPDGEIWSYTALLVVCGVGLMLLALRKSSRQLRHVANGFLLLAIGKVFLVDAPDLDGLLRAASFLVLGLSLAGLAWANRWVRGRDRDDNCS